MCIRHSVQEAYRKYHNNLMTSAYVFFNNQRAFTLNDLNMVVNKSGFNSSFGDREKSRYENVISGNMQLGSSPGCGTPWFIIMNMQNPTLQRRHSSRALLTRPPLKYAIQKARGAKVTFPSETGHAGNTGMNVRALTTSNSFPASGIPWGQHGLLPRKS